MHAKKKKKKQHEPYSPKIKVSVACQYFSAGATNSEAHFRTGHICMNITSLGISSSPTAGRSQRLLYNTKCVVHERSVIRGSLSLSSSRRRRHPLSKGKQRAHISYVLQPLKERDEVQQLVVCRVANPAFNGNGVVCCLLVDGARKKKPT